MANAQQRLAIPIMLKIKESTVKVLVPEGSTLQPSDVLASRSTKMLDEVAEGAILVGGSDVEEISTNCGNPVNHSRDIVKATEGRASKREGQHVVSFSFDPSFLSVLQESADVRGCTLDEHVSDCMGMALDNGWLGEVPPIGRRLFMVPDLEAWFSRELGVEGCSLQDIKKHIQELKRAAKVEELVEVV